MTIDEETVETECEEKGPVRPPGQGRLSAASGVQSFRHKLNERKFAAMVERKLK